MLAPKTILSTLPLLLLSAVHAPSVRADGAAIATAISAIQNASLALGSTVASWDGNILGAVPIVTESTALLGAINAGTGTARASANLTDLEAITVGLATIQLATDVNTTLATLLAAKPLFDRDLLTGVALLNLELEKSASGAFSDALLAKLPASFASTGATIAGEINAAFEQAIDVYSDGLL